MKTQYLVLAMLFTCGLASAQAPLWNAKFNDASNGIDEVAAMVADSAGNVYVTGSSFNGASGYDYLTIKYNTNGVRQWKAYYNGPAGDGNDIALGISLDPSGNVIVTGKSDALNGTFLDQDAATVKYNSNGRQLWVARYDGGVQRSDEGRKVVTDSKGNVFITGYTSERTGAHSDLNYLTIKYNSSGVQKWVATYIGPAQQPDNQTDSASAIALDNAGNVYVTGMSCGLDGNPNNDFLTVKYNSKGKEQWTQRYNGDGNQIDEAFALAVDNSANVYVTGTSFGAGFNDYDYLTIKYNPDGVSQWVQRYDDSAHGPDLAFAIALDNAANVYITGSETLSPGNGNITTIKYSTNGSPLWLARYDGGDNDNPADMKLDASGNIYVSGASANAATSYDIIALKYDNNGVNEWVRTFNGSEDSVDMANAIALDGSNNVYVGGFTSDKKQSVNYRTLKYSSSGALIQDIRSAAKNTSIQFLQNSPNPVSGNTKIFFSIQNNAENNSPVELSIWNVKGEKVAVLMHQNLSNGNYEVNWNAENVVPGIYFCRLISGEDLQMEKIIVAGR